MHSRTRYGPLRLLSEIPQPYRIPSAWKLKRNGESNTRTRFHVPVYTHACRIQGDVGPNPLIPQPYGQNARQSCTLSKGGFDPTYRSPLHERFLWELWDCHGSMRARGSLAASFDCHWKVSAFGTDTSGISCMNRVQSPSPSVHGYLLLLYVPCSIKPPRIEVQ
ncbi:hypothetical protein BCR34DRAFT_88907 [Clohesyomyces aquaticus]|uniref:Uncharacterized protein n=1 Tax=Clohesyomyces aquaticus TaxID=1231657 RepID=A0A1Y1YVS5_9PLEO|nr:hypothetical protein BCR34DRAFT_88907 [Clohesyomyces aquaticus]